jgi:5'-nucleotidase / UDP-sugar diphosphatase
MRTLFLLILALGAAVLCADDLLLDIMFSNDIHGGIDVAEATFMNPDFPPILGGGGSAAAYINSTRKASDGQNRDNLLLDAGDFFQGHPVGSVTKGRAVIEYMNMIGYDALTIGNHEFDIGEDEMSQTVRTADFPILSCNLIDKRTGRPPSYVKPFVIIEKMGIKFGIVGLTTTDTQQMAFPENIRNVEFVSNKKALLEWIPQVKAAGADIVIVLGHMGLPYDPQPAYDERYADDRENTPDDQRRWGYDSQEIAHEVPGIDLLIGGHMHKGFQKPWEDPITHTLVIQGYAYGTNIGHIILKIDPRTKSLTGWDNPAEDGMLMTLFQEEFVPDPVIADTIRARQQEAEQGMDEVIGYASIFLSREGDGVQSYIGNTITDAIRAQSKADFAFLNLGGIRGEIKMGPITYRDVFNVQPFDNMLVTFEADGAFLKQIIEQRIAGSRHGMLVSGANVVFSKKRPDGDRVTHLMIAGQPWDPRKTYKIATTDFLMEGNAGLTILTKVPSERITRMENNMRDEIVNYFQRNSPITSQIDNRWIQDDTSEPGAEMLGINATGETDSLTAAKRAEALEKIRQEWAARGGSHNLMDIGINFAVTGSEDYSGTGAGFAYSFRGLRLDAPSPDDATKPLRGVFLGLETSLSAFRLDDKRDFTGGVTKFDGRESDLRFGLPIGIITGRGSMDGNSRWNGFIAGLAWKPSWALQTRNTLTTIDWRDGTDLVIQNHVESHGVLNPGGFEATLDIGGMGRNAKTIEDTGHLRINASYYPAIDNQKQWMLTLGVGLSTF